MTRIGSDAFNGCPKLSEITIDSSLVTIENNCFKDGISRKFQSNHLFRQSVENPSQVAQNWLKLGLPKTSKDSVTVRSKDAPNSSQLFFFLSWLRLTSAA